MTQKEDHHRECYWPVAITEGGSGDDVHRAPIAVVTMTWLARGTAFAAGRPRAVTFLATSVVLLALNLSASDRAMYGDAAGYWGLARTFTTDHLHFSLDGYVDQLRGYSWPLALWGVRRAASVLNVDEITFFRVLSAFLGSAVFAVALPSLIGRILRAPLTLVTTVSFAVFALVYWGGHLVHPLSDFPALLLLATGVWCLPGGGSRPWNGAIALTSGVCLELAANVRPINEAALVAAVGLVGYYVTRIASDRRTVLAAAAFGIGIGVAALPQSLINSRTLGTRNPFAHAEAGSDVPNLYVQQLVWGVAIQRYETNLGPDFPVAVIFLDTRGQDLLALDRTIDPRVPISYGRFTAGWYLRLVAAQPLFFASVYGRHLFNGLDVAYPTPYVPRIAPRSLVFALVNYLVISLAAIHLLTAHHLFRWRDNVWQVLIAAIFLLPALFTIPTAIEGRFLLPLWMTIYGCVMFRAGERKGLSRLLRPWWALPIAAIAMIAGVMLAAAAYSHILGAPASFTMWCVRC